MKNTDKNLQKVNKVLSIKLKRKQNKFYSVLSGGLIGFINGFCGGGGGMICVPTLTFLSGKKDKIAHATAIFIMLPMSIVSFVVYLLTKSVVFNQSSLSIIGFVVGGLIGAIILKYLKNVFIEIFFSLIILACGIKMLI